MSDDRQSTPEARRPRLGKPIPAGRPLAQPAQAEPLLLSAAEGHRERPEEDGGEVEGELRGGAIIEAEVVRRESLPIQADESALPDGVERLAVRAPAEPLGRRRPNLAVVRTLNRHLSAIAQGEEPFGKLQHAPLAAQPGKRGSAKGAERRQEESGRNRTLPEDAALWPSGPLIGGDEITPLEVERLVRAMLTDREIAQHETMPGLSRKRLMRISEKAGVSGRRMGRFAGHILVWFANAGVTQPDSIKSADAWDQPRPLTTDDKEAIRRLLRQQHLPTKDEVELARAQGLNEGHV
jgi:hypothetical protein